MYIVQKQRINSYREYYLSLEMGYSKRKHINWNTKQSENMLLHC